VSKADLARRLNKSRAWVTQLLSGKANMTVRTLAEVVYTLDAEVKLHAQPPSWKMAGRSRRTRTLLRKYIPEGVMLSDELIGGRRVEAGRGRLRVRTTS
jgi:transcriptional regulator with XRE-family HTH domain